MVRTLREIKGEGRKASSEPRAVVSELWGSSLSQFINQPRNLQFFTTLRRSSVRREKERKRVSDGLWMAGVRAKRRGFGQLGSGAGMQIWAAAAATICGNLATAKVIERGEFFVSRTFIIIFLLAESETQEINQVWSSTTTAERGN